MDIEPPNHYAMIPVGTSESCPKEFTDYCANGGYNFYLEEQQIVTCKCPYVDGGKRCEKSL